MAVTLLLIYSVGMGNTAILTEKFARQSQCEEVLHDLRQTLDSSIQFSKCYGG